VEPERSRQDGACPPEAEAVRSGTEVLPGPRRPAGRRRHRGRRRGGRPRLLTSAALLVVGGLAGAGLRGVWTPAAGERAADGASPSPAPVAGAPPSAGIPSASARALSQADAARRAGQLTKAESVLLRARKATAHQVLLALRDRPVRTGGDVPGYARGRFGSGGLDPDGNGCDTRNDILRRDLTRVRVLTRVDPCVVDEGVLSEPYTGTTITFHRRTESSRIVQVGHVVSLLDAWSSGASGWPAGRRTALANDPLNLIAVDSRADALRQGRDASGWLPENFAFQCTYVSRQIAVKAKYDLSVTEAERRAVEGVLTVCSDRAITIGATGVLPTPPRSLLPAGGTAVPTTVSPGGNSPVAQVPEEAERTGATDFHLGVPAV